MKTLLCLSLIGSLVPISSQAAPAWHLIWSDEFNGRKGTAIDPAKWSPEVGGDGWGNNELEYYTASPANASLDGSGSLAITASRTAPGDMDSKGHPIDAGRNPFTSARLVTKGKFTVAYGRIEARIKIPAGAGLWPAFWLLGDNIDTTHWPACGEIDVMENIGKEPGLVHGSLHGPGYSAAHCLSAKFALPDGKPFADDFHVFAIEWQPGEVRWFVDGQLYERRTPADLPSGAHWAYDHPFFLLLNLAIGGAWPGPPAASTPFPATMLVDYVRVYQDTNRSMPPQTGAMH